MKTTQTTVRRLAYLVLAGALMAVALAGCGSPTDRPLSVTVRINFAYIGPKTDPQPMLSVLYSWDGAPEQTLLRRQAGSGAVVTTVQRQAIHGSTYTLVVRVVRDDTGEEIGYARQVYVVPEHAQPYGGTISLRDAAANPFNPTFTPSYGF